MTSKQRKAVKRECGVTVPPWAKVRYTLTEEECCLMVFSPPGTQRWEPFGATRTEPGELDNAGRPSTCYFFDRFKKEE